MNYSPPAVHRAISLCDEIMDFMIECGWYLPENRQVVTNIMFAIASGQFDYKRGNWFACWWNVRPEEVDTVKGRQIPADIKTGSVLYIAEYAAKDGHMWEMVKRIRRRAKGMQGVFWHRPEKSKIHHAPSQVGG